MGACASAWAHAATSHPLARRMRRILEPVMVETMGTPLESLRVTPIWEGVMPFLASLLI